jgi:chromosome segregation ATPase
MSTIGTGGQKSAYENLSALLEFVKSDDYQERIRELHDLEDSSRKSHEEATTSLAQSKAASDALEERKRTLDINARNFVKERDAFDKRVTKIQAAIAQLQAAIRES